MYSHLVSAVLFLLVVSLVSAQEKSVSSSQNQTNVKLQARILLETNNLDIDDKSSTPIPLDKLISEIQVYPTTPSNSATIKKRKRKPKAARSDGSLSNIWSMFLPGSSANAEPDYEESLEGEESGSEVSHQNQSGENVDTTRPIETGTQHKQEQVVVDKNNEKLVAKYSRPPRQDGMSSVEVMPANQASQTNQENRMGANNVSTTVDTMIEASTSSSKSDLQPVQLITGALSKDIGTIAPNMNDIVSNILGSMSWSANGSDALQANRSSSPSEAGEREDDDKQLGVRNQNTGGKSSNFERWLNRIQFQEPPVTSTSMTESPSAQTGSLSTTARPSPPGGLARPSRVPEGTSRDQQPATLAPNTTSTDSRSPLVSIRWPQTSKQLNSSHQSSSPSTEPPPMTDLSTEARLRQQFQMQHHQQPLSRSTKVQFMEGVKGGPAMQTTQRKMAMLAQRPHHLGQLNLQAHNKFQHPFQQQLRQHQAQLIHGIKQPSAQASTISVSTQDGTSNTSLSFAPNLSSLMNSLSNEMSQVVNSTPASARGSGNDEQSSVDSSGMFQSQDEILRQVTSAINFEQQFNQKRTDIHNHRKPGEGSPSPLASNDIDVPDSISKMFKVGSSLSELTETSTTSAPSSSSTVSSGDVKDFLNERIRQSNGSSQPVLGGEDIDKHFDLLAERLRALALQQQQTTNGSAQPSWLRRPEIPGSSDLVSSANLTRLAASLAAGGNNGSLGASSSRQPPISLELVRELLNKHERSKNELKSSQEAVGLLMQQLMQMNHSDANPRLDKQSSHQIQQRQNAQGQGQVEQQVSSADHDESGAPQQEKSAAPGASNIGWTPVVPSAAGLINPPPSPANQIKQRLRYPMKISQADNVGSGMDLANDDFYMNNLAFMFASSQQANPEENLQPNPRIIGLPIAILKEEDDIADSMPQTQPEALAEQLSGQFNPHMVRSNQQQQFAPRLAAQQQFEQPNHLTQLQQLAKSYSPQTFGLTPRPQAFNQHPAPNMAPRSPTMAPPPVEVVHQGSFQQQAELNNLASLVQDHSQQEQNPFLSTGHGGGKMVELKSNLISEGPEMGDNQTPPQRPQQPQQAHQQDQHAQVNNHLNQESSQNQGNQYNPPKIQELRNGIDHPLMMQHQAQMHQHQYQQAHNNIENMRPQSNDDFRLQRQSQHLQQQQQIAPPQMHPNGHYIHPTSNTYPRPPGLANEMTPHPHMRAPPMITTTIANGGPPVRLREVSLYKPFGFRSHHSLAYQASPAMAAMFPGLSQPSRPGLLRHMTPFRAAYSEGQRLLSPLIPHQLADNLRHHAMGQFQGQSLLNSLPIPAQLHQPYSPNYNQLKRHSHAERDTRRHRVPAGYSSASRLEVQHVEPDEPDRDSDMSDDFDHNSFEEIKFIPVESARAHPIEEEELHLLRKPVSILDQKLSRPSRLPVKFRQQRAQHFDSIQQSNDHLNSGAIKHCFQSAAPVRLEPTTTTAATVTELSGASSTSSSSGNVARQPISTTLPTSNVTRVDNSTTTTTASITVTDVI